MTQRRHKKLCAQCAKNFETWGKNEGFPPVEVLEVRPDRVLFGWHKDCYTWCEEHMDRWTLAIHKHRPFGADTALIGWRERRPWFAVQIVLHQAPDWRLVGEWDVDEGNPGQGALPALYHGLSWLWYRLKGLATGAKGIVDPFHVARVWRRSRKEWR